MTETATLDPLWVPVLTHYTEGAARLDRARAAAHLAHLTPHVRQYLLAGTTGDGWGMSDAVLSDWLSLAADGEILGPRHSVLVGAFDATTEGVIARARMIETTIADRPLSAHYAGLTICAPVDAEASQPQIADHIDRILAETTSDIAVYQLPQVVGCMIAPETFAALASAHPRIRYFKDTSGQDTVAAAGLATGAATLLRGAEGAYGPHLKGAGGGYDGWLLSTANGLAPQLRAIAEAVAAGDTTGAAARSDRLTALVEAVFAAAGRLEDGNPFSNGNRAVDHLMAHGAGWRDAPLPVIASGATLPAAFLTEIAGLMAAHDLPTGEGYLG